MKLLERTCYCSELAMQQAHLARLWRTMRNSNERSSKTQLSRLGLHLNAEWVCSQRIGKRLFPELPSQNLRALAGFLPGRKCS